MIPHPIHWFVDKFGILHKASDTIRYDDRGREYRNKRYFDSNDNGRLLVVSMGKWYESQRTYRPFIEAHEAARATAVELSNRPWTAPTYGAECTEQEWAAIMRFQPPIGRPLKVGADTTRCINLIMVKGYSIAAALRAVQMGVNSRRHIQRTHKEVLSWLDAIRAKPQ